MGTSCPQIICCKQQYIHTEAINFQETLLKIKAISIQSHIRRYQSRKRIEQELFSKLVNNKTDSSKSVITRLTNENNNTICIKNINFILKLNIFKQFLYDKYKSHINFVNTKDKCSRCNSYKIPPIKINNENEIEYFNGSYNIFHNKEGTGLSFTPNTNSIYYGDYVNGIKEGIGLLLILPSNINLNLINFNNDLIYYYYGTFKNNTISGKGELNIKYISTYFGDFIKNSKYGIGKEIYNDGSSYEGEYVYNERCGKGKYIYKGCNEYIYEGTFNKGVFDGNGKIMWKDGRVYQGDFKLGNIHGFGVFTWPSGEEYTGDFMNGIKNGNGLMKFKDGNCLKGKWCNGLLQGISVFKRRDMEKVEGVFRYGKLIKIKMND